AVRSRLGREIAALTLLAVAAFSELALLSFDPSDAWWRFPAPVSNRCGPVGALLAVALMAPLGWASHLVPLAALGLGARALRRGSARPGFIQAVAWVGLAASLSGA